MMKRNNDREPRFSIRKLTIGAVSVMFGLALFAGNKATVHADKEDNSSDDSANVVKQQKSESSVNASDAKKVVVTANNDKAEDTSKTADQGTTQTKGTEAETTQDQSQQVASSTTEKTSKEQQIANAGAAGKKAATSSDTQQAKDDQTVTVDLSQIGAKGAKKSSDKTAAQILSESKIEGSSENSTSHVSSEGWSGKTIHTSDTETDYELNGITDTSEVIKDGVVTIPNTADLQKDGLISENGKVYITPDTIKNITSHADVKKITISSYGEGDKKKVYASGISWTNSFGNDSNLTSIDLSNLDTSNIKGFDHMFDGDTALTSLDLSGFNTSNATTMAYMFASDHKLEEIKGLSDWDVSNVKGFDSMFAGDTALTSLDLSGWVTSSAVNMASMFSEDHSLTEIKGLNNWDVSNVKGFDYMFAGDRVLTSLNLDNWDTSSATTFNAMFDGDHKLTSVGSLANWKTSNVTNFASMFENCINLQGLNLANWDVSNGTDFTFMFGADGTANDDGVLQSNGRRQLVSNTTSVGDLSKWNLRKATSTSDMFFHMPKLTGLGDLSNWGMNKVTTANGMFFDTPAFTEGQDLSKWKTEAGSVPFTNTMWMFRSTGMGYIDLAGWDLSKDTDVSAMFGTVYNIPTVINLNDIKLPTSTHFTTTDFEGPEPLVVWDNKDQLKDLNNTKGDNGATGHQNADYLTVEDAEGNKVGTIPMDFIYTDSKALEQAIQDKISASALQSFFPGAHIDSVSFSPNSQYKDDNIAKVTGIVTVSSSIPWTPLTPATPTNNNPDGPATSPQPTTQPTNVAPHPEQPTTPAQPTTVKPHGENVPTKKNSSKNIEPKNETIRPLAEKQNSNKATTIKNAKAASTIKAASSKTLPQTGEKESTAGIIGLLAAGLAMLGLAGDRKREK